MQNRATKAILAGVATLSIGIGVAKISADSSSSDHTAANAANAGTSVALPGKTTTSAVAPQAAPAKKAAPAKAKGPKVLLKGHTLGSYFWDTGSSGNGDTGAPASGLPMQEGCFASPSWPMGTKGYVTYHGKKHSFFICDIGPGAPSHNGVMLDIDGITYAKLTGGTWVTPDVIGGSGQAGNIPVTYYVTHWGNGAGQGPPQPYN
jgi:hypothetical protein